MKNFLYIFCLFIGLETNAYVENRGLFPVGESEALMANTGVALSGSSGGAIFNPAGLAGLKQRKLSLSGNTYMNYRSSLEPLTIYDGQELSFKMSGNQAVPSSFISTWNWSAWTVAFSVVVPELVRSSSLSSYTTTNYNVQLSQMVENQFTMIGLSAGTQLKTLDLGLGCFLGNYVSNAHISLIANPKTGLGVTDAEFVSQMRNLDVKNLMCQAGLQKDLNPKNRLGLNIKLPSFHLSGRGEVFAFNQSHGGNPQSSGHLTKDARYDLPTDISLGLANTSLPHTTLLLDLNYQMAQSYTELKDVDSSTKNNATLRYNLGARYAWHERLHILGGYSYNPSTTALKQVGDMKEDFHTLSLGVESQQDRAKMGVAFFTAHSKGKSILSPTRHANVSSRASAIVLTTSFIF